MSIDGDDGPSYGKSLEIEALADAHGPLRRPALKPKPTKTTWVTREGDRIAVKDMTDDHLVNTIRFLRRNGERAKDAAMFAALAYADSAPMYASDAAANEADRLTEMWIDDYLLERMPTFAAMLDEAGRRGLEP